MGGMGSNNNIPFYRKYFLGGQNSIRGFQYRRVSPLNSNGLPLGGQSMIVVTAEVTHPIYKWIKGSNETFWSPTECNKEYDDWINKETS